MSQKTFDSSIPVISEAPRRWNALAASAPAFLLLGLAFALHPAPPQPLASPRAATTLTANSSNASNIVLPSATLVLRPQMISGYKLLSGKLQAALSVTGQAPLGGQVSRVLVRPGQHIGTGAPVLELSPNGDPAPRRKNHFAAATEAAEADQVAAAKQQEKVQSHLGDARARLIKAQARVQAAQARVGAARELVAKLQRGETIALPAEFKSQKTLKTPAATSTPRATERDETPDNSAEVTRIADAKVAEANHAAETAQKRAAQARDTADGAAKLISAKKQKVEQAQARSEQVQQLFKDGNATGFEVEEARANLADAQALLHEAETSAATSQRKADKLEADASALENQAKDEAKNAKDAARKTLSRPAKTPRLAQLGEVAKPSATPESASGSTHLGGTPSVSQVREFVSDAIAESSAAVHEAARIKTEIDDYEHQVNSTKERLDSSGKELDSAQQTEVERTIQAHLASVRAPAAGEVLAVAQLSQPVEAGDPLVTIGRADLLEVRFADASQAWKSLKPGMLLPVVVQAAPQSAGPQSAAEMPEAGEIEAQPARPAEKRQAENPATPSTTGVTIMAQLREIKPPAQAGGAATLKVSISNPMLPGQKRRRFRPGMTVFCSVAQPGDRAVLSVPDSAIVRTTAGVFVATLQPVASGAAHSGPVIMVPGAAQATQNSSQPVAEIGTPNAEVPNPEIIAAPVPQQLQWRAVTLGAGDGVQQEIVAGVASGERIALDPALLRVVLPPPGQIVQPPSFGAPQIVPQSIPRPATLS